MMQAELKINDAIQQGVTRADIFINVLSVKTVSQQNPRDQKNLVLHTENVKWKYDKYSKDMQM